MARIDELVLVPRREFDCTRYGDCLLVAALVDTCVFECPEACGRYDQSKGEENPAFLTDHAVVWIGEIFHYGTRAGGHYGHRFHKAS